LNQSADFNRRSGQKGEIVLSQDMKTLLLLMGLSALLGASGCASHRPREYSYYGSQPGYWERGHYHYYAQPDYRDGYYSGYYPEYRYDPRYHGREYWR
jgi:hypothetical protein